jgi:hypothetical protein
LAAFLWRHSCGGILSGIRAAFLAAFTATLLAARVVILVVEKPKKHFC